MVYFCLGMEFSISLWFHNFIATTESGVNLMMVSLLLLLVLFIPIFSTTTVNVFNSSQLVQYLCYSSYRHDLHLVLENSGSYNINVKNSFCKINVHGSLSITSPSRHTNISCVSKVGFIFNGIPVKIQNVTFKSCGSQLKRLNRHSSVLPKGLTQYLDHSVALLFINNPQVSISNTKLFNSSGFAMIAINPFNVHADAITVTTECCSVHHEKMGNGLFFYFLDPKSGRMHNDRNITISHSRFIGLPKKKEHSHSLAVTPVATGVTLEYTQRHFRVNLRILCSQFSGLSAILMRIQDASNSYCHIKESIITNSGIIVKIKVKHPVSNITHIWTPLTIEKTTFKYHSVKPALLINIRSSTSKVPMRIKLSNVVFYSNTVDRSSCVEFNVFDFKDKVDILLHKIIAFNNSLSHFNGHLTDLSGLFYLSRVNMIKINSGNFNNNYGSVFAVKAGKIFMSGNVNFSQNVANSGAAMHLLDSHLTLKSTNLKFINNTAIGRGGALYAHNINKIPFSICKMNNTKNNVSFINNIAFQSGSSIYAYPSTNNIYWKSFVFKSASNNSILYEVSTQPVRIVSCEKQQRKNIYAGQKFTIFVKAQDQWNHNVFDLVLINIAKVDSSHQILTADWHIPVINYYQIIEERRDNACTGLNLTLLTNDVSDYNGTISISAYNNLNLQYDIELKSCPIGFENKEYETCQCDSLINSPSWQCDISNQTITSNDIMWIGKYTVNNVSSLAYSKYCPVPYCDIRDQFHSKKTIKVTDTNDFKVIKGENHLHVTGMCESNRGGVLCGECTNGTSIVLGSDNCHVCSDWWLLTLMIYLMVGPLLIYLLYALKLTITNGTINGIIFYAQAANCGITEFILYPTCTYYRHNTIAHCSQIAISFLKILNLETGYALCLYNGMTMLVKNFFGLIFVLYLLSLVLMIIILSRYSTRLANKIANSSIQVLVTVLHLSFYKIMDSVIKIFSYTKVHTKNFGTINVWTYDGSVVYFSKDHAALMIFTLFIAGVFLVPYIVLLLGGRVLLKYSDKFRPVYEAIHGPYKEKKNYWFTARLFLLIAINVIYISLRSINPSYIVLFTSVLLIVFTIIQAHIRPFKNHLINMLDLLVMVLFLFQYIFSWYAIANEPSNWYYIWVFVVSVLILFVLFTAIVIGHIVWVSGKAQKLKQLFMYVVSKRVINSRFQENVLPRRQMRRESELDSSYYGSCNYREPLLDM